MNCEEVRQNAAAYALGALTEDERAAFERHVAECAEQHDMPSYGEVISRLSEAAPEVDPPAGLRSRILAAAESGGAELEVEAGPAAAPLSTEWPVMRRLPSPDDPQPCRNINAPVTCPAGWTA